MTGHKLTHSFEHYRYHTVIYDEAGNRRALVIQYGFHGIAGNTEPYFSITSKLYAMPAHAAIVGDASDPADYRRYLTERRMISCGCLHDDIRQHAPELAHLVDFHLWGKDSRLPMYYMANGTRWLSEMIAREMGIPDKYGHTDPAQAFKNHVLYGRHPLDSGAITADNILPDKLEPRYYLARRAPWLQEQFDRAMESAGLNDETRIESEPENGIALLVDRLKISIESTWVSEHAFSSGYDAQATHWRVTLKNKSLHTQLTTTFSAGLAVLKNGASPSAAMVLECLIDDAQLFEACASSQELAADLGYDENEARKIWRALEKNTTGLRRLLGAAEYQALVTAE